MAGGGERGGGGEETAKPFGIVTDVGYDAPGTRDLGQVHVGDWVVGGRGFIVYIALGQGFGACDGRGG